MSTSRFLGQDIGFSCLAKVLGVGAARLRRAVNLTPDLRFGKSRQGSTKDSFNIDAFFTTLHESVAETLPDRQLGPKLDYN